MIKKGKCIILSAPSGSGKTTLVKHLLSFKELNLVFSISATTREKRIGEIPDKDYYFIDKNEFEEKILNKEFIEYEEVYNGIFYGSLKNKVENLLKNNNVVFDIDVEGGIKLKKVFKDDALSIFVKPPSLESLKKRLIKRNKDSKKSILNRLIKSKHELIRANNFDKILINDDLDLAKKKALKIVKEYLDFD
ncbi:MAG: guanylate kinase [Flavobacteriaceae bacterium]